VDRQEFLLYLLVFGDRRDFCIADSSFFFFDVRVFGDREIRFAAILLQLCTRPFFSLREGGRKVLQFLSSLLFFRGVDRDLSFPPLSQTPAQTGGSPNFLSPRKNCILLPTPLFPPFFPRRRRQRIESKTQVHHETPCCDFIFISLAGQRKGMRSSFLPFLAACNAFSFLVAPPLSNDLGGAAYIAPKPKIAKTFLCT